MDYITESNYFGPPITEADIYPIAQLSRNEIITTDFARQWKFFIQFDTDRMLFFPILSLKERML